MRAQLDQFLCFRRRNWPVLPLIFLSQVALVPLQAATPAQLLAAAQAKAALLKALATSDLLFQSAMNRASLLQVRQLGYLFYNHFELKRTRRELTSAESDRKDPWDLWTQESGSLSKSTSGSKSQTANTSSGDFLLGVDYQICRDLRVGLFSGYLPSYTTLSGGLGSASTQGVTYGGSLSYGKPQGGFYADGVISGEGFRSSTSRPVIAKGKNYGTVSATPLSTAYTLGGDTGYDVRRGRWTYGPVAMVQYSQLQAGSINLSGPGSSSATVNAQCLESLYTGFGSHFLCSLPLNRSVTLVPEVRLFWSHEFLNGATTPTGTLSQNPGHTYSATTSPGKQNAGNAYAGITALMGKNFSSSLFYGGTVSGGDNSIQTLMLSVNLTF
jgi:outer membrane autotransporter protein